MNVYTNSSVLDNLGSLFSPSFTWPRKASEVFELVICSAACSLVNNDTKQFIISSETNAIREAEDRVRQP
jgi:hypothetical protein